jgi:polyisoprenoid-binding protein YceI
MKVRLIILSTLVALMCYMCGGPKGTDAQAGDVKDSAATANAGAVELKVDTSKSVVRWIGTKVGGKHNGRIKLASGSLKIENNTLTAGEFVIDLTTLLVDDLKGEEKKKLEGHLKSKDFFITDSFPTATFKIISVAAKADSATGATHEIKGNLKIKNMEKEVTIPARVDLAPDGKSLTASVKALKIDRSLWGITYKGMANAVISNDVVLDFDLVAAAEATAEAAPSEEAPKEGGGH